MVELGAVDVVGVAVVPELEAGGIAPGPDDRVGLEHGAEEGGILALHHTDLDGAVSELVAF